MYQMRVDGLRGMSLANQISSGGGSAIISAGSAQGSVTPAALQNYLQNHAAPVLNAIQDAQASSMPDTAAARCDCLLSAIPGVASSPDNLAAGRALCLQDPGSFEQQVRAAGYNPICDTGSTSSGSGGGSSAASFLSTTGGKVAVGVGAALVLGAIGYAVSRRK